MTLLLTDPEIADMRATLERTLPDIAVVTADTQVPDGAGGYTTTQSDGEPVACRVAPASGREATIAGRLDAVGTWTITLPANTPVAAPNRIYVDAVGVPVREFEVVLPLRPRSWELSRRVVCLEIL